LGASHDGIVVYIEPAHKRKTGTSERPSFATASPVLVCIDTAASTRGLIPHAATMAEALHAPLTLLHVLDLPSQSDAPADPVEWTIRRHEAKGRVRRAAGEECPKLPELDIRIVEGRPVDQICRCMRELETAIAVVGTKADDTAADWELGETARKLIDPLLRGAATGAAIGRCGLRGALPAPSCAARRFACG
jgi:nucleotide-binding universal stress UspA family protein